MPPPGKMWVFISSKTDSGVNFCLIMRLRLILAREPVWLLPASRSNGVPEEGPKKAVIERCSFLPLIVSAAVTAVTTSSWIVDRSIMDVHARVSAYVRT